MLKYQIRFCDSKGNGYFEYIEVKSKKGVEQKAAEKATSCIIEEARRQTNRQSGFCVFYQPAKPKRILHVWEWDTENKCVKKGGHRFKLQLAYFQATYTNGAKKRSEWYEPVIESK